MIKIESQLSFDNNFSTPEEIEKNIIFIVEYIIKNEIEQIPNIKYIETKGPNFQSNMIFEFEYYK